MRITGSISHEILTYLTNKNPDWERKLNLIIFSTFYGENNELPALKIYAAKVQLGEEVVCNVGFMTYYSCPWLGYSADGLHLFPTRDCTLLEVKCPTKGEKIDNKNTFLDNIQ